MGRARLAGTLAAWTGPGEVVVQFNRRDGLDSSSCSENSGWQARGTYSFAGMTPGSQSRASSRQVNEQDGGWYGWLKPSGERTAKLPKDYFNVGPASGGLGRG